MTFQPKRLPYRETVTVTRQYKCSGSDAVKELLNRYLPIDPVDVSITQDGETRNHLGQPYYVVKIRIRADSHG